MSSTFSGIEVGKRGLSAHQQASTPQGIMFPMQTTNLTPVRELGLRQRIRSMILP